MHECTQHAQKQINQIKQNKRTESQSSACSTGQPPQRAFSYTAARAAFANPDAASENFLTFARATLRGKRNKCHYTCHVVEQGHTTQARADNAERKTAAYKGHERTHTHAQTRTHALTHAHTHIHTHTHKHAHTSHNAPCRDEQLRLVEVARQRAAGRVRDDHVGDVRTHEPCTRVCEVNWNTCSDNPHRTHVHAVFQRQRLT